MSNEHVHPIFQPILAGIAHDSQCERIAGKTLGRRTYTRIPTAVRFWQRVDKRADGECWPWLGGKRSGTGYGVIWDPPVRRAATQVSWELYHGKPFPTGVHACHTCDNPVCVNPRHIWPGTMSENILDAVRKGRFAGGAKPHSHCKRGHPLILENVRISRGNRFCKACDLIRNRSRTKRKGKVTYDTTQWDRT